MNGMDARERFPYGGTTRPSLLSSLAPAASRVRADLPLAMLDGAFVVASLASVMMLRYGGVVPAGAWDGFTRAVPLAVLLTVSVNWLWGLYGQIWRHASVLEARRILLAGVTTGTTLVILATIGALSFSRSVIALGLGLYTMLAGSVRFHSRLFAVNRQQDDRRGLRVVILGAGESGAALVRDMLRSPRSGLAPVAMLDDNPHTHGRGCMGIRVVGSISDLPEVVARFGVHQAVLAIYRPSRELLRRAADLADEAGVPLRVLPEIHDVVGGQASIHDLRELRIEDLLGREQVPTDIETVRALLHGRRVLITGAGGSIGSEIARQVAECEPAQLLVLDHDETHLHDLAATLPGQATQLLADIRDRDVMLRLFRQHRPEIVFHAAAHKHVPVLEQHPAEALRTNVLGTMNVADAARSVGVSRFVFVSTDKAVRPSSVMGASKRVGEQVVLGGRPTDAPWCAVRFGNVLGSRGSVIPTFLQQINGGGPVTITDARMTRFFMSIREAVQLVLQSATLAQGGEVFILEMGEPVRILDLAQRMIRLSGKRVGSDVEIRVTGMRPGEKLVEELHTPDELLMPTSHPSVHQIRPPSPTAETLEAVLLHLRDVAEHGNDDGARRALFGLVEGQHEQRRPVQVVLPTQKIRSSARWPQTIDLTSVREPWSRSSI
jgi:FlaA1/EpsC-like NDP-sugar epimerase